MGIRNIELLFPGEDWPYAEVVIPPDPDPDPEPEPTEVLFTSQIPSATNQADGTYSLGTLFSAAVDGKILGIRAYVGTTPPSTGPLGLLYEWTSNTAGILRASKAFGTIMTSSWNTILFDTPFDILAGVTYVAAWGPTNSYCATPNFFTSTALVNGNLTSPASTSPKLNGKFKVNATAVYPDQEFNDGCYFVDPVFQANA